MKFDKSHKVILSTLSPEEAKVFIGFLGEERIRHQMEIIYAETAISGELYSDIKCEFWRSAVARHQDDIEGIDKLIELVKETRC